MAYRDKSQEFIKLANFVEHLQETSGDIIEEVERNNQRLVTKINRRLLVRLSQFCRVDLHVYYDYHWCPEAVEVDARSQQRTSNKDKKTRTSFDWPLLALIYYLYACVKLCLNIYLQYVYDYHLYQLEYSQIRVNNSLKLSRSPISLQFSQVDPIKVDKLSSAKRYLSLLGAPFYKSSYFIEIAYQFAIVLSVLTYMDGQLCFKWFSPIDFRFARVILFPKQEQLNYIQLVCKEVNKFISSSQNFSSTYLDGLDINYELDYNILEKYLNPDSQKYSSDGFKSALDQKSCLNQLKRLALYDQLRPLNWSPGWIERLSTYYCLFTVTCLTWGTSILVVTGLASPLLLDVDFSEWNLVDNLMAFESLMIIIYLIIAMTFYSSVVFLSCLDQILYVNKLRSLIEKRSQQNRNKYFQLTAPSERLPVLTNQKSVISNELQLGTMNCNILYCFMHYKVFVAQFKTHRATFEPTVLHSILIWFFLPIMARLHAPYIAQQAKLVQLYICVAICVVVNFLLVPICHLYGCSLRLYKSLSSLLANTIETQSIEDTHNSTSRSTLTTSDQFTTIGTRKSLYNLHLIGLLRKELNESDIFMNQFATTCIGLHMSYPSLVKFHFWFGVILLSLISGVTTGHDSLFGGSLSDPFNLFA